MFTREWVVGPSWSIAKPSLLVQLCGTRLLSLLVKELRRNELLQEDEKFKYCSSSDRKGKNLQPSEPELGMIVGGQSRVLIPRSSGLCIR